jgi:hypothetical protein
MPEVFFETSSVTVEENTALKAACITFKGSVKSEDY